MSAAGQPQGASAPSGGSAAHAVASVGAITYLGRFAPSPTGPLHAGSLVAALASWLDARAHGGRWLVRIEDVDEPRCVQGTDQIILQQLAACGLLPDKPPVWQSQRGGLYQRALDQLVAQRLAYPCACSRRDIDEALARQGTPRTRNAEQVYPGTCRDGLQGRPARAWRLKTGFVDRNTPVVRSDRSFVASNLIAYESVRWHDRRLGDRQQDVTAEVGDFILRRADGYFAYQLAVVVDDADQGITDVVRGEDLADNTPRQMLLQRALGVATPRYLHTPLVLGANGEKLSKQNGAQALDVHDTPAALAALHAAADMLGLPPTGAATPAEALAHWVDAWRDLYNRSP